jgi:Thioesterase superfamily
MIQPASVTERQHSRGVSGFREGPLRDWRTYVAEIASRHTADTRDGHAGRCEPEWRHFRRLAPLTDDLAGGSLAAQRAKGRCATVAVDGMVFHEPVFVGDEVSCYGELVRTGRTSMTVRIEAWRRHLPSDEVRKVTEATFTYVAIGEDRRPRPLPPVTRS